MPSQSIDASTARGPCQVRRAGRRPGTEKEIRTIPTEEGKSRNQWAVARGESGRNSHLFSLLVAYFPREATDRQLLQVFEPFGQVAACRISREGNGTSKCYGFVSFAQKEAAEAALAALARGELIMVGDDKKWWHLKATWSNRRRAAGSKRTAVADDSAESTSAGESAISQDGSSIPMPSFVTGQPRAVPCYFEPQLPLMQSTEPMHVNLLQPIFPGKSSVAFSSASAADTPPDFFPEMLFQEAGLHAVRIAL